MNRGCGSLKLCNDIDEIKIHDDYCWTECKPKAIVHDMVKEYPRSIKVEWYPYPDLIPVRSIYNEKYVHSEANDTVNDNLLKLPQEQVVDLQGIGVLHYKI